MAKIPLSSGFTLIPEGTYVFQITNVVYEEDFGKMEITLTTADNMTHIERFRLLSKDGKTYNQGALNAFSYFAKTALNDFDADEIDEQDLVGHYIRAEVVHTTQPSSKNPDKMVTFANLGDKEPADGFDDVPAPVTKPKTHPPAKKKKPFNLDDILG